VALERVLGEVEAERAAEAGAGQRWRAWRAALDGGVQRLAWAAAAALADAPGLWAPVLAALGLGDAELQALLPCRDVAGAGVRGRVCAFGAVALVDAAGREWARRHDAQWTLAGTPADSAQCASVALTGDAPHTGALTACAACGGDDRVRSADADASAPRWTVALSAPGACTGA
jgi:hypothetical protein